MTGRSRILWIVAIIVALVLLGQLLAVLRWVFGAVILVALIAVVVRALARASN